MLKILVAIGSLVLVYGVFVGLLFENETLVSVDSLEIAEVIAFLRLPDEATIVRATRLSSVLGIHSKRWNIKATLPDAVEEDFFAMFGHGLGPSTMEPMSRKYIAKAAQELKQLDIDGRVKLSHLQVEDLRYCPISNDRCRGFLFFCDEEDTMWIQFLTQE